MNRSRTAGGLAKCVLSATIGTAALGGVMLLGGCPAEEAPPRTTPIPPEDRTTTPPPPNAGERPLTPRDPYPD
jgi:hypothetical protein